MYTLVTHREYRWGEFTRESFVTSGTRGYTLPNGTAKIAGKNSVTTGSILLPLRFFLRLLYDLSVR